MAKINWHTESGVTEGELELKERKEAEALYDWFESGQDERPKNEAVGSKRITASEYNTLIRGHNAQTTLQIMRLHTRLLKERRERTRRKKNPS